MSQSHGKKGTASGPAVCGNWHKENLSKWTQDQCKPWLRKQYGDPERGRKTWLVGDQQAGGEMGLKLVEVAAFPVIIHNLLHTEKSICGGLPFDLSGDSEKNNNPLIFLLGS